VLWIIIDNHFYFEELIPAICWIAPDIPMAMYRLVATGFPV
jgi:hypothetical protein